MNHHKIKLLVLIALFMFAVQPAFASDGPELPAQCGNIAVEAGNKLAFTSTPKVSRSTVGIPLHRPGTLLNPEQTSSPRTVFTAK